MSGTEVSRERRLKQKIGQMLVVGFPGGKEGLEQLSRVLERTLAGNLILFSRNVGEARELHGLVAELNTRVLKATGVLPLVSVDQEGGVVARIRKGVTPIPGSMAQAAAYEAGLVTKEEIRSLGSICGRELAALGLNWNLAPVADVNVNPRNPVIGVRSYGESPELAAELCAAYASGLGESGVLATAKHFPGHGDTEVDSHLGLPLVPHDRARLEAVELLPFRRLIAEGVPVIMTAHVRFPAVEPEALPATLSRRVLTGLLRGELGFKGLICTDCLEMKAIADHYENAAARAVAAGADLVCVSHTEGAQVAAAESIFAAVMRGEIDEARIDESVARIMAAKARIPARLSWEEASPLLARPESLALSTRISRASLSLYPGSGFPAAPGSLYIDIEAENLTGAEDGAALDTVASALRKLGSRLESLSLPAEPGEAELDSALAAAEGLFSRPCPAEGRPVLVLGLYNPKTHPGQVELLKRLARLAAARGRPLALVSMRSPYDAAWLADSAAAEGSAPPAVLCSYEYSACSATSVAEFLTGLIRAEGRLPGGAHPAAR